MDKLYAIRINPENNQEIQLLIRGEVEQTLFTQPMDGHYPFFRRGFIEFSHPRLLGIADIESEAIQRAYDYLIKDLERKVAPIKTIYEEHHMTFKLEDVLDDQTGLAAKVSETTSA